MAVGIKIKNYPAAEEEMLDAKAAGETRRVIVKKGDVQTKIYFLMVFVEKNLQERKNLYF